MGGLKNLFGKKEKVAAGVRLREEEAYSVPNTNRSPWSDFSALRTMTPETLASALTDVRSGECPEKYLEMAQEIELRDLHYRSVLSTRKDAVCGLDIKVTPASDDKKDIEIAEAVNTDIVKNKHAKISQLIRDCLDALAKGFAVSEIIWDTGGGTWKPCRYIFRDPRWFQYDKQNGKHVMLRDTVTNELHELSPFKYVIHEPHLISGTQITSGLALPALFYFMIKNFDVTSWAAFIDRYGFPIRLGKYGAKATEDDIRTLKRAVASIGADFGAVIPESAEIEIIQASSAKESADAYERLATWVDKQISKLVLGQTMTTDEGSSRAQSQTHEQVREDIAKSDIAQLEDTLNAMLVVPYVNFNFSEQESYPTITLYKPDEKNVEQIISAVEKLGSQGLRVKADEIRELLGLSAPDEKDEVVGGITPQTMAGFGGSEINSVTSPRVELNAAQGGYDIDSEIAELEKEALSDYVEITDEIASVLEKACDAATDFDSFQKELERLVTEWKPDDIARLMALSFFKARAAGSTRVDADNGR